MNAQYKMGFAYARGKGVPKDDATAYMWCNIAAAQGNSGAEIDRDNIAKEMTKEQIAEAQKLSREWLVKHSK